MNGDFVWEDAGRTVVFRRGGIGQALELVLGRDFDPFALLSTPRALGDAPELAAAVSAVHEVGPGAVADLAAPLLDQVDAATIVALGGGRVIDVAKSVASVSGARVVAIPTTLSGAEMSANHRAPAGAEGRVRRRARAELVIADPEAMTSAPEAELRASSMNALAHGADCLYTPLASPVSVMCSLRGAASIAGALDEEPGERDRAALALGSILCGYAVDSAKFGLHHPVCQTLVRVCGTPHAGTNAAVLPRAAAFLAGRAPEIFAQLAAALGTDPSGLEPRILELGEDPPGLGALGADRSKLGQALEQMLERPELASVPGPPLTKSDLAGLVEGSW
ncbi:MAG: iron-containing alcohol dehydrogenase [Solirubrobacterales bacterium]|nr:iron-containing alcohol dehydrogenase [Solirubrobacterales bacterium]